MHVSALRADRAFDFWGCSQTLPDFCKIAANPDGIARELNDVFTMTLFCDFEAPQAAISTMISWIFTRKLAYRFLLNAIA
jgi:hypothetical protein